MDPHSLTAGRVATDDEAEAVLAACRVLVAISAQSIAAAESVVDLAEFRILVILATIGSASTIELADHAEIHHATACRMCDRLRSANFVMPAGMPEQREGALTLTAQGQGVVHLVMSRRRAAIEPILAQLPETARASLVDGLRLFTRAAGEPSLRDLWAMGWTH